VSIGRPASTGDASAALCDNVASMNTHLGPPPREFDGGEFALVVALAFGMSIVGSVIQAFSYSGAPVEFTDKDLAWTLAYELVVGAIIAIALRKRGWKWSDFAIHPSKGSTILGAILAILVLGVWYVFEKLFGEAPTSVSASLASIAAVSIVNPLFEELLALAYVVQALRKRFGLVTAMNVSLAIRLLYHLYQGPLVVIPIAIFGLVATLVFIRMGRLWPVIVMHAILDLVGLISS
jgi:membrane protease YdiL (CAAX protease family)